MRGTAGLAQVAEIEIKWDMYLVFCRANTAIPSEKIALDTYYVFNRILGEGSYAQVRLAVDFRTCVRYACKRICVKPLKMSNESNQKTVLQITEEISLLKSVSHPNIVAMQDVFFDKKNETVCLIMQLVPGGDLYDYIVRTNGLPEHESQFIFYQLLLAIDYLHSKNICHRDLKAENVLIDSSFPFSKVLIADFGLSRQLAGDYQMMRTQCGTLSYLAPEVLDNQNGYNTRIDCWALGVLLYVLITASLPFSNTQSTQPKIVQFTHYAFRDVSPSLTDLIAKLLDVDPETRLTVGQALKAHWIHSHRHLLQKLYAKVNSLLNVDPR